MITEGRVREIIEAYGGDARRWPEAERAAVEAYLAQNAEDVADALAEAQALDAMLAAYPEPAPSAALRAAILAKAPASASGKSGAWLGWLGGARPALGVAMAVMLSFGVATGYRLGGIAVREDAGEALWAAAFSDVDVGLDYEEG